MAAKVVLHRETRARGQVILGKFAGCWFACGIALLVFYLFFGVISGSREHTWPVLNYVQGFSNVSDFPLTFAVGIFRGSELFGSFKAVTRIDRDVRPIFTTNIEVGGVIDRYPYVWRGARRCA